MEVDRNGFEVLGRDECLRLLASATIGRVGLSSGALPKVLPVNFRLAGENIFVRASRGSMLEAASRNTVVAFEVDDVDAAAHVGWSVIVTGIARPITDAAELERFRSLPVARWAPKGEATLIAISTELVTGRRLVPWLHGELEAEQAHEEAIA